MIIWLLISLFEFVNPLSFIVFNLKSEFIWSKYINLLYYVISDDENYTFYI